MDPTHNVPGTPFLDPDSQRNTLDRRYHKHASVRLDRTRRGIVHKTISEVAQHRGWTLHALNVRTNHVHIVVNADAIPERVMNAMKSWATRRMVEAGILATRTKAWTRHGSTRYLWKADQVEAACRYVCEGQGADLQMERD